MDLTARLIAALQDMHDTAAAAGQAPAWPPPSQPAWAHLPVAIHDLVWNLGRNYDAVTMPIIRRYADHIAGQHPHHTTEGLLADVAATDKPGFRAHTATEGHAALEALGADGRLQLAGDKSPASPQAGAPRRADTVWHAHTALLAVGLDTVADARAAWRDPDGRRRTEEAIRSVAGLGVAAKDYWPLLIGLESIKPDRHVVKWFGRIGIPAADIRPVTAAAVATLNARQEGRWTIAGIDHAIWRVQSGRPLLQE